MSASDSSVISVEENSSQLIGDGDGDESVCFAVGDKFYTYDELKKKIDAYEIPKCTAVTILLEH